LTVAAKANEASASSSSCAVQFSPFEGSYPLFASKSAGDAAVNILGSNVPAFHLVEISF
jgi:hypothetical protein